MLERRKTVGLIRTRLFLVALTLMATWTTSMEGGMVTFSDSTFNDSDWSSEWIGGEPTGFSGATGQQLLTGGTLDDGPYRQTSFSVDPDQQYPGLFHAKSGAVFDPSSQGAVTSLSYSMHFQEFTVSNGQQSIFSLGLTQDGSIYRGGWFGYNQLSTGWASVGSIPLNSSHFTLFAGSGPTNPDFSSTGSPIQFGYITRFIFNDANTVETLGVDNWRFTVDFADPQTSAVPEPSSIALLGTGLAGLLTFGVRRRRALAASPING